MAVTAAKLAARLRALLPEVRGYWVAYSGGRDSHVLLALLAEARAYLAPVPVRAIHIDHGLQSASSEWADHCAAECVRLEIPFERRRVHVRPAKGEGKQAAARRARYAAFEAVVGPDEALLTAHHRDDQAETLLFRLLRGAGVEGLAAMPVQRRFGKGWLLRPMLDVSRDHITELAQARGLRWIDDPTNASVDPDRNFLRLRVLPLLEQRWPSATSVLARDAEQLREAAELIAAQTEDDWRHVAQDGQLSVTRLRALNDARQRNLLRYWIRRRGWRMPSRARLTQGLHDLLAAAPDRQPELRWTEGSIRRYGDALYLLPPLISPVPGQWRLPVSGAVRIPGVGRLTATRTSGTGLRLPSEAFTVTLRRGGERLRPVGHSHSRRLKHLLQEGGVPPWERERLPLLYCGGELAAVADRWIAADKRATGDEPGVEIRWEREFS